MPELLKILETPLLGNSLMSIFVSTGLIIATYIIFYILKKFLNQKVAALVKNTSTNLDDILFDSVSRLVSMSAHFVAIFIVWKYLKFPETADLFIKKALIVMTTIFIAWILQNLLVKVLDEYFKNISKNISNSFLPFIKNILKLFLWAITAIFILSNLGYSIASLAAGLGIGGLAIALAVKPTLEAFFASIAIFSGKPFKIGDMVKFDGYSGTVKQIGLRTTKIKTFSGTEVIVPNIDLANNKVENITKRMGERIDASIGVTYDTTSKHIEKGMDIIKKALQKKEGVDEDIRVWFDSFGDFALIIKFTFFIDASLPFMERREIISNINFEIKKAFEKDKIEMAFPTQTIYVKK
ncbi:mechanosensitive ion channel family protein [Candidatus Peregrinibacteria bacterium]|jgi:MscS family membrane protein|nr:mechanosensitive ion channel family protein [Candidatus Peregrinibacteria bacterium]